MITLLLRIMRASSASLASLAPSAPPAPPDVQEKYLISLEMTRVVDGFVTPEPTAPPAPQKVVEEWWREYVRMANYGLFLLRSLNGWATPCPPPSSSH